MEKKKQKDAVSGAQVAGAVQYGSFEKLNEKIGSTDKVKNAADSEQVIGCPTSENNKGAPKASARKESDPRQALSTGRSIPWYKEGARQDGGDPREEGESNPRAEERATEEESQVHIYRMRIANTLHRGLAL